MTRPNTRSPHSYALTLAALSLSALVGSSGHLSAEQATFETHQKTVTVGRRSVDLSLVRPVAQTTPPFLVVFASGDGGLRGVSKAVLQHLAQRNYWVVGFSSPDAFKGVVDESKGRPNYGGARDRLSSIIAQGKAALGLPERTPILITGMSRGANVVVAGAGDAALRPHIVGAVAIALTREFDELTIPDAAKDLPGVKTDDQRRLQTYAAIERLGSMRLAIIQSTNDKYVRSAESRRLLGPDTATRRLYEVEAKNHSFGGGQAALMHDLDEALAWISGSDHAGGSQ